MGLNLKKIGDSIFHGLNPLDNGQGWTSRAPTGPQYSIAQQLNRNIAQPISQGARGVGTAVANTARLLPQGAALGADVVRAQLTSPGVQSDHNLNADLQRIKDTYSNSLIGPTVSNLQKTAGMLQTTGVLGPRPQDVLEKLASPYDKSNPALAAKIRQQGYDKILNNAGVGINDSPGTVFRKAASNIGQTAALALGAGETNAAKDAITAGATPVTRLVDTAKSIHGAGLSGGLYNISSAVGQDNFRPGDVPNAFLQGYGGGAAAGAAGAGVGLVRDVSLKNPLETPEIAQLKAQKQASLQAYHNPSAEHGIMKPSTSATNGQRTPNPSSLPELTSSQPLNSSTTSSPASLQVARKPKPKVSLKQPFELKAMTGMHDILNSGGTIDEALYHYGQVTGKAPGQGQVALQKVLGSKSLDTSSVNAKLNPETGNVKLGAISQGDHTQPILNSHAIATSTIEKGNTALEAIKGLSSKDHALLDQLRGDTIGQLTKQAENPEAFRKAAEASKAYNDFTQAAGAHLGQNVAYRKNYGAPLLFEQDPATISAARKAFLKDHPGYGKSRTFKSYDEAAQYGLVRRNENFGQDIATDVSRRANDLKGLALSQGLEQAYPGQVKVGEIGFGGDGTYKQLQIPGGQAISVPAALADEINRRAPGLQAKGLLKGYDTLNANLKYYKLGGGSFHGLTTAGTVAGQQIASGAALTHPIQNLRIIAGTLSDAAHQKNMTGFAERGVTDNARIAGVTLGARQTVGDVQVGLAKRIPVIKQIHDAVFGRQIPEAKLTMFEQQTKGLDPSVPEDLSKMRSVARAVNNLGGINRAVDGLTPQTSQRVSRAVLATDFTEGKFRTLDAAIRKGGPEGKIARQMVVGKTIVFLLPTLAAATAAGKIDWQDPKSVADNIGSLILDPQLPTPFKGKTGIARIAKTPETFISELGRIVKPMFDGSGDRLSGAKHYAGARLAAAPSLIEQVGTNQDYAGNPIIQRNPDGGINVGQSAANVGINSAPIPVSQGIKVGQGKQSLAEAAVNTAGLRTGADKNDPQMKAFAFQDKTIKGLSAEDQARWNAVYGSSKDKYGNSITVTPALDSQDNAATLLAHQNLLDTGKKINDFKKTQGLPSDPFFDLSREKQQTVLNLAVDKFRNPAERTLLRDRNPWLNQYNTDRSAYFNSLPKNPDAIAKTKELPEPQPPQNANEYFSLTDPKQKAQYLADHPEITDYFNAHDQFIRTGRAKQGLPQYDKYPVSDPATQKLMDVYNSLPKGEANGKSRIRSAWIKSHPKEWDQITAQFSKQAQYSLEQDAQQAAYQGTDFTDKGIKDIKSLAQDLGLSSTGAAAFRQSNPTANPYLHAISINAGVPKKASVSAKSSRKKIVSKRAVAKANVSIKKSLV